MPYESHYVDSGKGLHKFGHGIVTGAELCINAAQTAADVERARLLTYGIADFTRTTEVRVTMETIRDLIEINRKLAVLTPGRVIAIVAPDPLAYGLSRSWQTFTEDLGWKANVFYSRGNAIFWVRNQLSLKGVDATNTDEYPSLRYEPAQPDANP